MPGERCLDVGCGTGVLCDEMASNAYTCTGVDLDLTRLNYGRRNPACQLVCADGAALPFKTGWFHWAFCHLVLLWVKQPATVLSEMRRVTKAGQPVFAFAEPDYGGRIDFPAQFEDIGKWQTQSLQKQGADPFFGRKLLHTFSQAGFSNITGGIIGAEFTSPGKPFDAIEWQMVEEDLHSMDANNNLKNWKAQYPNAVETAQTLTYVPFFYAIGYA